MEGLELINQILNDLYALKRKYSDNPGWNNETLKLLFKSIVDVKSLEETLIQNLFELKQRLKQEIVADQIYLVFTKTQAETEEIRTNLNEAIAQLNNLDRLVEGLQNSHSTIKLNDNDSE